MRTGIAANADAYTFPDREIAFPYGLKRVDAAATDLASSFGHNLIILLGEKDADANQGMLDESPPAMRQGPHRLAWGQNPYEAAHAMAAENGRPFEWRLEIVPGVGHEDQKMAAAFSEES